MKEVSRKIDKLGRIVIPVDFRKTLGLNLESDVILSVSQNMIILRNECVSCSICGSQKDVVSNFKVCSNCIRAIKNIPD